MQRPPKPLFLAVLVLAVAGAGAAAGGVYYAGLVNQKAVTFSLSAVLCDEWGTVKARWGPDPGGIADQLAIMFKGSAGDQPCQNGWYIVWFPSADVTVRDLAGTNAKIRLTVTGINATWKGSAVQLTTTGAPDSKDFAFTVADLRADPDRTLSGVGNRRLACDAVIANPPAAGSASDVTVSCTVKAELFVDDQLVSTKTGTATGTATFVNTGTAGSAAGTISVLTVHVSPGSYVFN